MLHNVIDDLAKDVLLEDLQWIRNAVVERLDGLSEYDVRRPLTVTGTNLLGLVKHLTLSEIIYLGDVFGRPFPDPHPRFDDPGYRNRDSLWVRENESRSDIVDGYRRACRHADSTIAALPIDTPARIPWWPRPNIVLFNAMTHVLTETNRHAGHADILREQLTAPTRIDEWAAHRARIEEAARRAE